MGRPVLDGRLLVATVGEGGNWSVVERHVQNQGKPREDLRQFKLFSTIRNTPRSWRGFVYFY